MREFCGRILHAELGKCDVLDTDSHAAGSPGPGEVRYDSAQVVIDRIETALGAGDPRPRVVNLFEEDNWRPHLVAAIALLLDDKRRCDTDRMWRALARGSWVSPQLVVTAYLVDREFPERLQDLVNQGYRSPKLLGVLFSIGRLVPSLHRWLNEQEDADPWINTLWKHDVDHGADIANLWLKRIETMWAQRNKTIGHVTRRSIDP